MAFNTLTGQWILAGLYAINVYCLAGQGRLFMLLWDHYCCFIILNVSIEKGSQLMGWTFLLKECFDANFNNLTAWASYLP